MVDGIAKMKTPEDAIKKLRDLYPRLNKDNLERLKIAFIDEIQLIDDYLKIIEVLDKQQK